MKLKELSTYHVGDYSRLSRDDGKKGKQESMSIENQKRLLETYCKERGWSYEHYSDDGWSGMNFNRPRFNDLMNDIKAKKINCVVVKCLDRFGRGSQTGEVIEELFRKKIRFIAISEGFDTLNGVDDIIDVLAVVNGMYPKMVSRKVKQVKRENTSKGMFMNSRTAFGYMKDPADKHKLIINEEAAKIVRRIFTERAAGESARAIAARLTAEEIDCPDFYYYRRYKADKGGIEILLKRGKVNAWNSTTLSSGILRNEVYLGHLIAGKREVTNLKENTIEATDKEDWIVVPNNHDAIISQELWERVHNNLKSKQRNYRTKETGEVSLFASILRCKDCGAPLAYTAKKLAVGYKGVYKCSRYNNTSGDVCTTHYIDEEALSSAVITDLRQYAVLATSEREKLASYLVSQLRKTQTSDASALNAQINIYEGRLLEIKAMLKALYKDKIAGKLDEDVLSELMDDCIKERADIEGHLPKLREEVASLKGTTENINQWLDQITDCLEIRTLDRTLVTGLVEKITVGEKVRLKGQPTTQEILINYRFIGNLLANANEDASLVN